jgi:hypothetical protein
MALPILRVASRNIRRQICSNATFSPQIERGLFHIALNMKGLLVETGPAGRRDKFHLNIL